MSSGTNKEKGREKERKNVGNVFLHWALMISKVEVLILSYDSLNKVVPFRALYK